MRKCMVAVARVLLLCAVVLVLPATAASQPSPPPPPAPPPAPQSPPQLTFSLNQNSFQPGDTHILMAGVSTGGSASPVDVYVALQLPDQTLLFYQSGGSFTQAAQPLVGNWTVAPYSGEIFRYTFSGAEPAGTYTWYAAFADPGTLNFIGDIAQAAFTLTFEPTQPIPGWYRNSGPSTISEDSIWRVGWQNSYVYQHPGTDNLYWYGQVEFRNVSSQTQDFFCTGVGCPSCIKEHISRGGTYLGYVPAEETFCTRNPDFTTPVKPGEAFNDWVIFHNVPWKGDEISLEWGSYGSSAWVDPWYSAFSGPPAAECPQELVTLGTCQPVSTMPEGKAPNLIVLVHGCCTDANDVRNDWYSFGRLIAGTIQTPGAWEVVVWDWSEDTAEPYPGPAYNKAELQAANLATTISPHSYAYLHMIGHSTGARLIDLAAKNLAALYNNVPSIKDRPFIHLTFLDAYTPNNDNYGYLDNYPEHYAEHYVDRTFSQVPDWITLTNTILSHAFNFDITDWVGSDKGDPLTFGHFWPIY